MATLEEIQKIVARARPNRPAERPDFRRPEEEINLARKELETIAETQPELVVEAIMKIQQFNIEAFANVLASIGEPAIVAVLDYVAVEDRKITSHMVQVMGVLADERFVDIIVDCLMPIITQPFRQQQIRQRTHIYVNALKACDAEKALERLSPLLDDDSIDSHLRYCLRYVVNQLKK